MENKEIIGKIHDVLFAGVIYFCEANVKELFTKTNIKKPENYFEYYDEIKDEINFISEFLYPLFYYDGVKSSPINEFYLEEINKENLSFDTFIKNINDDNIFKKYIMHYIFGENFYYSNKKVITEMIYQYPGKYKYKLHLFNLVFNYSMVKKELITTIKKIYPIISKLHDNHKPLINNIAEITNKEDVIDMHVKRWKIVNKSQIKNSIMGYSLLNRHQRCINIKYNRIQFMFGLNYIEPFVNEVTYENVSYKNLFICLSNPSKVQVIDTLYEKGEMTTIALAELLDISYASMNRYVNELFFNSILTIVRHEGIKVYFGINKKYFDLIYDSFENYIGKFRFDKNDKK